MMWNKDKFMVLSPRKLYFRGSIQIFSEFFVVCIGPTKSTKISTPRKLPTVRYPLIAVWRFDVITHAAIHQTRLDKFLAHFVTQCAYSEA